jgi:PAS domain S-box-containing protein
MNTPSPSSPEELINQNLRLNLLLNSMDVALWDMIIDPNDPVAGNNEFWWSDEFRKMLGFTDENDFPNILSSWSNRLHPKDKERTLNALAAHLNDYTGKTPYNIEYELLLKNGQYRHFHAFGETLRNKDGFPLRIAGALEDIDEHKRTKENLARREKILNAINEMAVTLLSHEEKTFGEVMSNGIKPIADVIGIDRVAVYRLIEKDPPTLGQIYLWYGKTIPLDDEMKVVPKLSSTDRWLDTLLQGEAINVDASKVPADEAAFLNHFGAKAVYFVPIFTRGEFWGLVTLEDHTNFRTFDEEWLDLMHSAAHLCANAIVRNENERELVEKNELNRIMFDNAPVGLTIFDENFKYIDCNDAVLKMYGVTKEFYASFFGSEKQSPEYQPDGSKSRDKALKIIKRVLNGEEIKVEWVHLTPEGEPLPVELTMVRMKQGDRYIGLGYIYDMREQNRLKAEVETALAEAQEANHAKSAFLANMSHEIRTPINAIVGMTNIGKSAPDAAKMTYCFTRIEEASNHLLGIINDILDISKIESGKLDLSPSEFNFERMLHRVANVVGLRMEEKYQSFKVVVDRAIPEILVGDEQRLAQVITNLIGNAVKFTPQEGTIQVDTCFLGEKDGVCTIEISVADSGIGLSHDQQVRLFQPFHQAEASTTRKYGGTGLGLAISKRIVEMMGGKIWIDSELGQGATFSFTFQAKRGEKSRLSLLERGINWKNLRILVVDDDPDTLFFFEKITTEAGAYCDTASNAEEALGFISTAFNTPDKAYNIFFIDWKLPDIDGMKLAEMIRNQAKDDVAIIMLSAAVWNLVDYDEKTLRINKFLNKPIFSFTIVDVINDCLGTGERPDSGSEDEQKQTAQFPGKHILLAEDVDINCEIVLAMLEPTLLEITCAQNGKEAVQIFSESPEKFDMIFMDIHMPEMDGYEATRHIRSSNLPNSSTIPIIAMTANVFREDIEKCLKAGMNDHIGKPVNFDEVIAKLRSFLG